MQNALAKEVSHTQTDLWLTFPTDVTVQEVWWMMETWPVESLYVLKHKKCKEKDANQRNREDVWRRGINGEKSLTRLKMRVRKCRVGRALLRSRVDRRMQ